MRLAVVGGKLQGVEAAYLARKAGWEVLLVDRRAEVPARGLCDSFLLLNVTREEELDRAFRGVDLVLPALEDAAALAALGRWAGRSGRSFAFDPAAYAVSSSKLASNRLIGELGLPRPLPWRPSQALPWKAGPAPAARPAPAAQAAACRAASGPQARFPLLVKPDGGSGSRGVRVCRSREELERVLSGDAGRRTVRKPSPQTAQASASRAAERSGTSARRFRGAGEGDVRLEGFACVYAGAMEGGSGRGAESHGGPTCPPSHGGRAASAPPADRQVVEEYLEGPSYSLEVIGAPGRYRALQVTDLAMDAAYDCKRVRAPSELAPTQAADFERESLLLAEALRLKGLMDVEVILHGGRLKILEIDARLPSQTPTAVYWSTGLNMVKLLGELFAGSAAPPGPAERPSPPRGVVYEHLLASPGRLEVAGEHVMSRREPLRLVSGFFGADEALTDYAPGRREWAATLIVTASDRAEAWRRRNEVIGAILRSLGLPACLDPEPAP